MKPPSDFAQICEDLKVCGRREFGLLIRMRHKFQTLLAKAAKAQADEEAAKKKELEGSEDEDAKIDRELEETMKRIEKQKKRAAKKEKVAADKSELRKKMSVIATTTLDNDEDLLMSRRLWEEVQKKGFEGVGEKSDEDSSGSDDDDGSSDGEESKGRADDEDDDSEMGSEDERLADGENSDSSEEIDEK